MTALKDERLKDAKEALAGTEELSNKIPVSKVAELLKKRRIELGMSQHRLSRVSGVSQSTINSYELMRRKNIGLKNFIMLTQALGMTIDELLREAQGGNE